MLKYAIRSNYKPAASIRFAPIKNALAVTVEPIYSSASQSGVAYELSHIRYDGLSPGRSQEFVLTHFG